MIELDGTSAEDQTFVVTPQQAAQWIEDPFTVYLFEATCDASDSAYYWIGDKLVDNPRFTKIQINLTIDFPEGGNIKIEERGLFRYTIYGQTSTTNLDPKNESVVGVLERGVMRISGALPYTLPTFETPPSVIYYE